MFVDSVAINKIYNIMYKHKYGYVFDKFTEPNKSVDEL